MSGTWKIIEGGGSPRQAVYTIGGESIVTISGLSTSITGTLLNEAATVTFDDDNDKLSGGTIKLGAGAFDTAKSATITASNGMFSFDLVDTLNTSKTLDKESFKISLGSGSASVTGKLLGRYEDLDNSIVYYAPTETEVLATIKGLSNGAASGVNGNISLTGDKNLTISLAKGALSSGKIELTQKSTAFDVAISNLGFNFNLALAGDTGSTSDGDGTESGDGKVGYIQKNNAWTLSGDSTTLNYGYVITDGWSLASDGKSISYEGASTIKLATINGLSAGLRLVSQDTDGSDTSYVGFTGKAPSVKAFSVNDKVITIYKDALEEDPNKVVTVTSSEYTFKFDGDDGNGDDQTTDDNKLGFKENTAAWSLSNAGTATHQYTIASGWAYDSLAGTIKYAGQSIKELAKISGLSTSITGNDYLFDGSTKVFTLKDSALAGKDVTLDGAGYSLALTTSGEGSVATAAVIDSGVSSTLTVDGGGLSAVLKGKLKDYYSLVSSSSITYTSETLDAVLAKITGLSSTASEQNMSLSGNVITLGLSALKDGGVLIEKVHDDANYSFALSGVNTLNNKVDLTAAATITSVYGGIATIGGMYEKYYTAAGTSIVFTEAKPVDLTTIKGLNSSASAKDVQFKTSGTSIIELTGNALGTTNISFTPTSYSLKLSLKDDTANGSLVGGTKSAEHWSVSGGTASLQTYTNASWKLVNSDTGVRYTAQKPPESILTISGLSSGLSATIAEGFAADTAKIAGISLANNVVKLSNDVLTKNASTPIVLTSSESYSLSFAGDDASGIDKTANDNKLGFKDNEDYWYVDGTDVYYQYTTNEGWTLNDAKNRIDYTDATTDTNATKRAKITGLVNASGISAKHFDVVASGGGASVIKLTADVLSTTDGATISLTDYTDDPRTYKLAFADDATVSNITGQTIATGLHFAGESVFEDTIADGTAEVRKTRAAGWSFAGDSLSITRLARVDTGLATISGLGAGASSANIKLATEGNVILIQQGALSNIDVTLTSSTYKLALNNGNDTTLTKFGFETLNNAWENGATSATYYYHTKEGWSLNAEKNAIDYRAEDTDTRRDLAFISGLKGGYSSAYVTAEGDTTPGASGTITFKLKGNVLGTDEIKVIDKDPTDSLTFALAFDETTNIGTIDGKSTYGFGINNPGWKVEGDKAVYQFVTKEGWTLNQAGTSITHTNAVTKDLATITGLKDDADLTKITVEQDNNNFAGSSYAGTITLQESLLASGANIVLANVSASGLSAAYKLSFGNGNTFNSSGVTLGSTSELGFAHKYDTVGNTWNVASGTAVYTREIGEGWTLNEGGLSATYAQGKTSTLFTITGLDADAKISNFTSNVVTNATYSSADIKLSSFVHDTGVVDKREIKITYGDDSKYTLSLADGTSTISSTEHAQGLSFADASLGKVTVMDTLSANGWYGTSGASAADHTKYQAFTFYEDVNDKWATITGLSSGVKAENLSLSATGDIIKVKLGALSKGDVELTNVAGTSHTYKLALDGTTTTYNGLSAFGYATLENAFTEAGGTSVAYYSHRNDVWALSNDGLKIDYTPEVSLRSNLAVITGLKGGFSSSYVIADKTALTDGGKSGVITFRLKAGALSTATIAVADANTNDNITYKFAFADDGTGIDEGTNNGADKFGFKIDAPTWVAGGTSGTFIYQYTKNEGWTLGEDGKITYTGASTTELARITGLSAGVKVADLNHTSVTPDYTLGGEYKGTFTLTSNLFGNNGATLTSTGGDYKLQFGAGTNANGAYGFEGKGVFSAKDDYWVVNGTNAYFTHNVAKGWTLDQNSMIIAFDAATTETNATIAGLAGVTTGDSVIAGITVDNNKNFTLSKDVLPTVNAVTVTGATGVNFKLAAINTANDADNNNEIGHTESSKYWAINNNKDVIYQYDTTDGWSLNGGVITYQAANITGLATITGLEGESIIGGKSYAAIDDITITDKRIILGSGVLGTQNVELISDDYDYSIDLASNIATAKDSYDSIWTYNSVTGSATYDSIRNYYYEDQGNFIKYTPEKSLDTLASIGGLSKGLKVNDDRHKGLVTGGDSTAVSITAVQNASTSGVITIYKDAFAAKTVSLTGDTYNLAMSGVESPDNTDLQWVINGGKATLKGEIKAGYSESADSKFINYTAGGKNQTILIIEGLNTNIKDNLSDDKSAIDGIVIDDNSRTVTLAKDVLGTVTAKITGTYSFATVDNVIYGSLSAPTNAINYWTFSNGTAKYQNAIPAYYTLETDGSIKYHGEDVKETYTTITGLASDLVVGSADIKSSSSDTIGTAGKLGYIGEDGYFVEAVKVTDAGTDTGKVIVAKEALNTLTSGITLTDTTGKYEFEFDTKSNTVKFAPEYKYTWEASKTNAILKADITEGYTLETETGSKKITYSKAKEGQTIVTVSGLSEDLEEVTYTEVEGNSEVTKTGVGVKVNNVAKPITFNSDTSKITVPDEVLGSKKVEIKNGSGYSYTFAEPTNGSVIRKYGDENKPEAELEWVVSGTTAKYTNYTPEYRQLNEAGTVIEYNAKAAGAVKITIEGLPKGIKVNDNGTVVDSAGTVLFTVNENEKEITVNEEALSKGTIKVKEDGYTLKLADNKLAPQADQKIWTISGTTATLKEGTTEGYALEDNGKTLKYKAASLGSTLATVTGLKSGLKVEGGKLGVSKNGKFVEVATIDNNSVINLNADALGTTSVKVTSTDYTLGFAGGADAYKPLDSGTAWVTSGTTAYLKQGKTAGFTASTDGKELTYSKASLTSTLATVKGLKSGTKANSIGEIDGLSTPKAEDTEITVSKNVLDPKTALTIDNYTFALDSTPDNKVTQPESNKSVWSVSSTDVKYDANGTTAGYVLGDSSKKISYSAATLSDTPSVTIEGLKSGLKLNENGTIDGIKIVDNDNKVILSKSVLGTKNISLAGDYTLELDSTEVSAGTITESEPKDTWVISGTTATFKTITPKGYKVNDDDRKSITYTASTSNSTAQITLSGLAKGLKATTDQDGKSIIEGISVDANKNVTLDSRALGTSNVTFKTVTGSNYKLAVLEGSVDYAVSTSSTEKAMWTVSGTTATLRMTTPAKYTLDTNNNKVTYTAAKYGATLATVKGLASGLKVSDDGKELLNGTNEVVSFEKNTVDNTYTVKLSKDALDKKDVSIAGTNAKFNEDLTGIDRSEAKYSWTVKNGTATLTTTTPAGYALNADKNKLVYTAAKTVKTTITGLKSSLNLTGSKATLNDGNTECFTVSGDKIIVNNAALDKKKVSINGGDYTLDIASDVNSGKDITDEWTLAEDAKTKSTTATYNRTLPADSYYCDGKTITYLTAETPKELAKITGLKNGLTLSINKKTFGTGDASATTPTYSAAVEVKEDGTIKLKKDALQEDSKNKVVLTTSNTYKLALADDILQKGETVVEPTWSFSGTTAQYGGGTNAYYTLSTDGKTITYTPFKIGTATIKLSNINTASTNTLTQEQLNNEISVNAENKQVNLTDAILNSANKNISVTTGDYKLAYGTSSTATVGGGKTAAQWYVNSKSISYEKGTAAAWKFGDSKTASITAASRDGEKYALAVISGTGLKSGLKVGTDGKITGVDITAPSGNNNGTITLSEDVFNKKTLSVEVSLTSGSLAGGLSYALVQGGLDIYDTLNFATELVISKSNATIKQDTEEGYALNDDGTKLTYYPTKAGNPIAKISGLNSKVTEDDITLDKDAKKVILGAGALGTSTVKFSTQGGYSFALEDDVVSGVLKNPVSVKGGLSSLDDAASIGSDIWSVSNTTATLKNVKSAYYTLGKSKDSVNGFDTVNYEKSTSQNIATVAGLKKGLKPDENGYITGIDFIAPVYDTVEGGGSSLFLVDGTGVIVIDGTANDIFGTTTIKVATDSKTKAAVNVATNGKITDFEYKIQADGYDTPELSDEAWTNSKGSATLKGAISKGFTPSADGKSLVYSAAVAKGKATFASVKGLNTGVSLTGDHIDPASRTVYLSSEEASSKVTVGAGKYEYDFGPDYENGSITGSTSADTITVNGFGVSVNAGNGDDYVTFYGDNGDGANQIGDTFIYGKGNGNDVIVDFSSYDKIKLTNVVGASIAASDFEKYDYDGDGTEDDLKFTLAKDSKGNATSSITFKDLEGTTINIVDKNGKTFAYNGSEISEVTSTSNTNSYVLGDSDFSLTPTPLGNQSDSVAYSGDKNDKK